MATVKSMLDGNVLTIAIEGRIDSTNAADVEALVKAESDGAEYESFVLDVENLEYISSAGLRIILRLRKENPTLKVINANAEVYDVFDMTGFTEMITIEKAYRKFNVDGCEILGEGSNGVVYRYSDEIVIKVYRNSDALDDIHRERELARKALILGIPTAIPFDVVKVGDKYASVFELLKAKSFSKLIKAEPENTDKYVTMFMDLLKQIHSTEVNPDDMPDMKATALGWAKYLEGHIPEATYTKLISLVEAVPDSNNMIHGDYHTNNVEMQNGEVLLIDMDTLSHGNPVFEWASIFLAYEGFSMVDHTSVERFLKLPYETAGEIYNMSISKYFGTDDESEIEIIKNKAKVVGCTRLLRRTLKREADTEMGKKLIEACTKMLVDAVEKTDSIAM